MRMVPIVMMVCFVFSLTGCVSTGKYELKEKEAGELGKTVQELRQRYAALETENVNLKARVKQLTDDLARLGAERDRLVANSQGLEASLKSTADAKNQKIAELSQAIGALEKENVALKDEIARLGRAKEEEVRKTSRTYEEMLEKMKGEISQGQVTISELKGRLTVNMLNAILFDSGKAEVKPEGLVVLQKVIDILKDVKDKTIRIEGHTDNVQITGELARRYPTNWELSAARAINVARHLQQQGIDPGFLSAIAYGEYKPVEPNDTEEGKARNRRIEIILAPRD